MLALALGILAASINTFSINILSQETPLWGFGGALILAAFVLLGRGPGLVAALTQLLLRVVAYWGLSPAAGIGGFIYVLEALFAWYLYKRVRTLHLGRDTLLDHSGMAARSGDLRGGSWALA